MKKGFGSRHSSRCGRKNCPTPRKTPYATQAKASRAMMRCWSHDPSLNMLDMHTYLCPCGKWHFGHISYYKKYLERKQTNETATGKAEDMGSQANI